MKRKRYFMWIRPMGGYRWMTTSEHALMSRSPGAAGYFHVSHYSGTSQLMAESDFKATKNTFESVSPAAGVA